MSFSGGRDPSLLVEWILGTTGFLSPYHHRDSEAYNDSLSFLHQVQSEAKSKIACFESFVKGFLPGMSEHAGPNCNLRMLSTGVETSLALKKSIASYLGVPAGKTLPMLQRTVDNLSNLPSSRHTCNCSHCGHLSPSH